MNITFKNKGDIPYSDLDIGDIFNYGGSVYMLTDQQEEDMPDDLKSVNLANGEMEIFGKKVMVNRYEDAELILS